MVHRRLEDLHRIRWSALLTLLILLFLGGLVVSVKIGGGADLHNMDGFLVLLALIATSFFAGTVAVEGNRRPRWDRIHWIVALLALLVPVGFSLPKVGPLFRYDHAAVARNLEILRGAISEAGKSGGRALFITERQLLTFDYLADVPLIHEYEQMELMEMAMSGNRQYLERYYSDLQDHRFAIIVAEEQKFTLQKRGSFVEENGAWVRYVGAPLLCAYKPAESLVSPNIQVFVPRPAKPACKNPFLP